MALEDVIRQLVEQGDGRASVERVVREALGVPAASGALARRLAESAVRDLRGLVVEGDEVVARATTPAAGRVAVLALSPPRTATALPPVGAWLEVGVAGGAERGTGGGAAETVVLAAGDWRAGLRRLGDVLAGAEVFALTAATARRTLRLAATFLDLTPEEEPRVTGLGPIARALNRPIRSAEDAAALVGEPVPEAPEQAAVVLARLVELFADLAELPPSALSTIAIRDAVPEFDFADRAFNREDLVALPEAPGVYLFEDADGGVAYVGKAVNLRRRVGGYFRPEVSERDARIREAAHALTVERTGTELSALLREQRLIGELMPALNTQEDVHASDERRAPLPGAPERIAVVQPSADGGAEVVVCDRTRGVATCTVVPDREDDADRRALLATLGEIDARPAPAHPDLPDAPGAPGAGHPDAEVTLRWLARSGQSASVVDVTGPIEEAADLLCRLARDPDLGSDRIVPVG